MCRFVCLCKRMIEGRVSYSIRLFLHTVSKREEIERADRWSAGDRIVRSSTMGTTPEITNAKTPDSLAEESMYDSRRMPQSANRRPYGGIAVLPPILVVDKKDKRTSLTQDSVPDRSPVIQKTPPTRERSARTPDTARKTPVTPEERPTSRSKSPFSENLFESWDSKMQEVRRIDHFFPCDRFSMFIMLSHVLTDRMLLPLLFGMVMFRSTDAWGMN